MRAVDRDLIRGGHYGQRSCEPHLKAEHMAAPTNAAIVKKALANPEPSTHGPERRKGMSAACQSAIRATAELFVLNVSFVEFDSKPTLSGARPVGTLDHQSAQGDRTM